MNKKINIKFLLSQVGMDYLMIKKKNLNAYKSYIDESKTVKRQNKKRYDYFLNKTNEVFNNEFKGFDFKLEKIILLTNQVLLMRLKNVNNQMLIIFY